MNARILRLGGDEHQAAQVLLPWFVNGTLDAAEAAQIGEHVAQCSACQADVAARRQTTSIVSLTASSTIVGRGVTRPRKRSRRGW